MTPLFHLENIVRTYPDPASRDPHAVRTVLNLSELDIRAGERERQIHPAPHHRPA